MKFLAAKIFVGGGDMGLSDYIVGKLLGEGSYGKALLATRRDTHAQYVIKEVNISKACGGGR
jgi:hypothetical protein